MKKKEIEEVIDRIIKNSSTKDLLVEISHPISTHSRNKIVIEILTRLVNAPNLEK